MSADLFIFPFGISSLYLLRAIVFCKTRKKEKKAVGQGIFGRYHFMVNCLCNYIVKYKNIEQ